MKKKFISGLLVIILCCLTGCVSNTKYDQLKAQYDEVSAELKNREDMYFELQDDYNSLSGEHSTCEENYNTLVSEYDTLESEYNELQTNYEELQLLYSEETEVVYDTPTDLSGYATDITYDNLARTPDDYEGKALCLSGEVVQLIEDSEENQIRLAVDGDYDQIILIGYDPSIVDERILEDDYITIYGISIGIYTYESTLGGMISVPAVWVEYIEMN